MKSLPEHGTRAGYQRHLVIKGEPCSRCREAANSYTKRWQQANPDKVRFYQEKSRPRYAALMAEVEDFNIRMVQKRLDG